MTRNQKIALGCGGAGCLGLIVLAVVGVIGYTMYQRRAAYVDFNSNDNYNYNSNANRADTESSSSSDTSGDSSSSSSMSDDAKHRLFQAAGMSGDSELTLRVMKKLGYMDADGSTNEEYQSFTNEHFNWAMKNLEFIQSINTPDKARAYVEEHIDD